MTSYQRVTESKQPVSERPTIFTFPLFDGVTAVKCTLPNGGSLTGEGSHSVKEKVVIALDRSGSMHYVMSDVCKASIEILRSLFSAKKNDVGFVAYNYETKFVTVKPESYQDAVVAIKNIQAGGQTGFAILLTTIQSYLASVHPSVPITIFVLTDGQETCSPMSEVNGAMESFKAFCASRRGASKIVTLGFTNQHDATFLTKLSNLGTHPGFFAYAQDSKDLTGTMRLIEKVLSVRTIDGTLHTSVSGVSTTEKLTLIPSADEKTMEGYLYLNGEIPGTVGLSLNLGERKWQDVIQVERVEPEKADVLEARLVYFSEQLKLALSQETGELARRLSKQLGQTREDAFKVRDRPRRRRIMQEANVLGQALDEILAHFAKGSGSRLNNEQIARLSDLAYRGGKWKAATQRKMNVRKDKNANLFNEIETKVKEAVATIEFDSLDTEQDVSQSETDTCIYSCLNWVDALKDGDCLGIALDVGRTEAAIHDPTQFTIKTIHPSFITGNSFMDALEYAMDNSHDSKQVHGGFDRRNQGHVIPGVARESITGMLPLYYNKEHWKVARHQMKAILGWMVTLDPMGYTASQYMTVPFLVMARAAQDTSSNGKRVFRLIADTCQRIYQDWRGIGESVKEIMSNYADPAWRTVDKVPHQSVFMCQLFCAMRAGDVSFASEDHAREFWYAFAEETIRRGVNFKNRNLNDTVSFCEFFGIDVAEFVRPYVELTMRDAKNSYTNVSAKAQQIRQAFPEVFSNVANPFCNRENKEQKGDAEVKFDLPWEKESYQAPRVAKKYLKITEDAYEWFTKTSAPAVWAKFVLVPDMKDWGLFSETLPEKLEGMPGMSKGATRMAFSYQTVSQRENQARRRALENGEYVWFWDPDFAIKEWLKEQSERALERERKEAVSEALNRFKQQTDGREGEMFASSDDLAECVALLQGRYHGANLQPFWKPLTKTVVPLMKEKLRMILTGQFRGIPLLCDKYKSKGRMSDPVEWYPDKKNTRAFYFNIGLRVGMTPDEFAQEFPQTAQHVQPLQGRNIKFDPTKL